MWNNDNDCFSFQVLTEAKKKKNFTEGNCDFQGEERIKFKAFSNI